MPDKASETLVVGKITGVYGVKGWVKVYSWTQPRENILGYRQWRVGSKTLQSDMKLEDGKSHGKGIIAKLEGCDSREQAEVLQGEEIRIYVSDLKKPAAGEFYWRDLVGLKVTNLDAYELGVVERLFETGANDVLVVKGKREYLIPWIQGQYIRQVNLDAGTLLVDWDEDF